MNATRRPSSTLDTSTQAPLEEALLPSTPSKTKAHHGHAWGTLRQYFIVGFALFMLAGAAWLLSCSAPGVCIQKHWRRDQLWSRQCPLHFARLSYRDVAQHKAKPYLLGGKQQPSCQNCHAEHHFAKFCPYASNGPVCPPESQWELQQILIDRAEMGSSTARGMLLFTPCDLYPLIEGRTVWLVGDSIMQEFMKAMQCIFFEFMIGDFDTIPLEALNPDKAVLHHLEGGWCSDLQGHTRLCHLRCNMGDRLVETLLPSLRLLGAKSTDIMVLNIAVWMNKGQQYIDNLRLFAEYWPEHSRDLPVAIWRDASPQHFDTPTGDFGCDECPSPSFPFKCQEVTGMRLDANGHLHTDEADKQILVRGGWRNDIANPIMEGLGIPVMKTWNYSLGLWQFHHHYQANDDCTHSCHPSAYQLWIHDLFKVLEQMHTVTGGALKAEH